MTEYEHLEKLLDEKLTGFLAVLELKLSTVSKEVTVIADELCHHQTTNEELEKTMRESIIRVHARIDALEKTNYGKLILTKAIEWAVPAFFILLLLIISNGTLIQFAEKVVK